MGPGKRQDSWIVGAEDQPLQPEGGSTTAQPQPPPGAGGPIQSTNYTIIHDKGDFYMYDHAAAAAATASAAGAGCVTFPSPVGILRPNWILDSQVGRSVVQVGILFIKKRNN